MIKKDPVFNIVYPLIIIVVALLGIISALAGEWKSFLLWIILFSALVSGLIYINGWMKMPDLSWIKMPKFKKKEDAALQLAPNKVKANEKKIAKKSLEQKAPIKRSKNGNEAGAIKNKEDKRLKVYESKEEDTRPKTIETKKQELKLIELKRPEKKSDTQAKKVETEFDQFIKLVKEKKEVSLEEIEKKFNLTREKAEDWARLLESHGLVEIRYPAFGEPKLIYKDSKEEL